MKWKNIWLFSLIVTVAVTATVPIQAAIVPEVLNYQGTLTDNSGTPLSGNQTITFRLHAEAASAVENFFWMETQNVILDSNGRFSVTLGSDTGNPLNKDEFTGQTFLGIQVGSDLELMPRQQLTSVAYALKAADAIPQGGIIMWNGSSTNIPTGWALCDGTNGTPDLRSRFIIGAGYSGDRFVHGNTGGEESVSLAVNEMPSHTHTGPSHRHSVDPPNTNSGGQSATHNHQANADGGTSNSDGGYFRLDSGASKTIPTGAASNNHTHQVNIPAFWSQYNGTGATWATGTDNAHNNMPPYFALAFIMKL